MLPEIVVAWCVAAGDVRTQLVNFGTANQISLMFDWDAAYTPGTRPSRCFRAHTYVAAVLEQLLRGTSLTFELLTEGGGAVYHVRECTPEDGVEAEVPYCLPSALQP